ncbi:MAG: hypothetical protein ABR879_05950 [Methanomassiliicoccales archaeon]|jgi:hypothetical protein
MVEKRKVNESEKLAKLLVRLAKDPKLAKKYAENPGAVLKKAGIDEEMANAVSSGDVTAIRKIFADRLGLGHVAMFVIYIPVPVPPMPVPHKGKKKVTRKS